MAAVVLALSAPGLARPGGAGAGPLTPVIVRGRPGARVALERAVEASGGTVGRRLGLIDGFAAEVPARALGRLRAVPGVRAVVPDGRVRLLTASAPPPPAPGAGSLAAVARTIGATDLWRRGVTGRGVDVALIDSGVVPVEGLRAPGKVLRGPDLSFESQAGHLRSLDTNGHGTHMAGIIAGRDDGADPAAALPVGGFLGVAPDARIVSVKVATSSGMTDVSQVIAAIDWVVQHRERDGLRIRVLNLSFGTHGTRDPRTDPLAYAAEVAWRRGVVVVAAAGNRGAAGAGLNDPASDPYVLAVGAADTRGTPEVSDDTVPDWSSRGDGHRDPDLVAPGRSIESLRNPGSRLDLAHPGARSGSRLFRGSGTSQAAAVVSGAVALVVQQRPGITPDEVKALLASTASPVPGAGRAAQGAGLVDVAAAGRADTPAGRQRWPAAAGTGSLELARGGAHATIGGAALDGERDIFGRRWDGATWARESWEGATWSGGAWNGSTWSGDTWSGDTWSGVTWSGVTWSGTAWSGVTWSGNTWSGDTWSGDTWSGDTWSGDTWSTLAWDP